MTDDEPEALLTRAGLVLVLGGVLIGLSLSGAVGHASSISRVLLLSGTLLVAGGVVSTVRSLYQHWKDRAP